MKRSVMSIDRIARRNSWQGQPLKRKFSYETEFLVERKNSVTRFVYTMLRSTFRIGNNNFRADVIVSVNV